MADRSAPSVYSIAAHRGFADALVAGLIPRYAEPDFGLARLTLLLPNRRAERTITEAFVRLSGGGLLLPRMAMVGDLDLDETLGPLLDPLGAGSEVPPAADPTRRWLRLAEFLKLELGDQAPKAPGLLRLALETARTMDRLTIEGLDLADLLDQRVAGIVGDLAHHWQQSTRQFARVRAHWEAELALRGEVDPPVRRNLLFSRAAQAWEQNSPDQPIVAAGVTSASPALARLLRVIANLPRGAVILPDLDLSLDPAVWDMLGDAGAGDQPFGEADAVSHPQYHLKLLLARMNLSRDDVQPWHRAGLAAAPPERSRAISNLFLPAEASAGWVDLPAAQRRLAGVRLMESAHPGEEAQAIAILMREALEVPERRVALITPDRGLAGRVAAHLRRWGIEADDTAGQPLSQTTAGRVLLLLAEVAAQQAAPVPLLALLGHPWVRKGDLRAAWLDHARALDLALRGPRPAPGLIPLRAVVAGLAQRMPSIADWWAEVEAILLPLFDWPAEQLPFDAALGLLAQAGEALCGTALWSNADGRALAALAEELREAAQGAALALAPADLYAVLRDAMDRVAVRPPWGGHPRAVIYGMLEARMSRADLVICGGLTEGSWPASPAPDPLLPPAVLRALGVPGAEFRTGLAAHDLAAALGAPEVVLSFAMRDDGGPVIPSRFVLRVKAMLGELAAGHAETRAIELARAIDLAPSTPLYRRPAPDPGAAQRDVPLAVTAIDRLLGDPYQFYAGSILRLRRLDALDAEPSAAWKGTVIHRVLERWHKAGGRSGELLALASEELAAMQAHPLVRSLWWPRLASALEWIDSEVARLERETGRSVAASEIKGAITIDGVKVHGRADRIDRLADGSLAIVDYKTGKPPTRAMVAAGNSLQLGVLGLIAEGGGFAGVSGAPEAFEYWSFGRDRKRSEDCFGYVFNPFRTDKARGLNEEEFLDHAGAHLAQAIRVYIKGSKPFEASLQPDLLGYNDYDQLMRLDEWQARGEDQS